MYVIGAALAVLSALAGIIYIFARAPGNAMDHFIMSIGALVAGFVLVVSLLAVAELLKLAIDVEHNTRTSWSSGRTTETPTGISAAAAMSGNNDGAMTANRLAALDEETAEAALIRGH